MLLAVVDGIFLLLFSASFFSMGVDELVDIPGRFQVSRNLETFVPEAGTDLVARLLGSDPASFKSIASLFGSIQQFIPIFFVLVSCFLEIGLYFTAWATILGRSTGRSFSDGSAASKATNMATNMAVHATSNAFS